MRPGVVFPSSAPANTYEYLLGKTRVYINRDETLNETYLDLWRNKANMSLTNSTRAVYLLTVILLVENEKNWLIDTG